MNYAFQEILRNKLSRISATNSKDLLVRLFVCLFVCHLISFNFTLASNTDLPETNLNRIFKLLKVYIYLICIFR